MTLTRCLIHAKDFYVQCEYCAMAGRTAAAALEVERWGSAWWWEVDEMECKHGEEVSEMPRWIECKPCYLADYRRENGRQDKRPRKTPHRLGDDEAAMTFNEISVAIGETPQNTWQIYRQAMAKLRRKPQELRLLLEMSSIKQRSESRYPRLQSERF